MKLINIFSNKYFVPILAILACILWGSAFPSLKISYQELMIGVDDYFSKMLFASYRFFIAAIFLFVLNGLINGRESLKIKRSDLTYLFILGMMQTTLQYFFFYNGLANTTAVKGSILTTLGIFFTVIFAHFIYKNDKLSFKKASGLIFGFLGVVIVNLNKGTFSIDFTFQGEGFIILAQLTSTIAAIMTKDLAKRLQPLKITAYQMLMGSIVLFLLAIIKVNPFSLPFTLKTFMLLIYLAFVSAAGFGIWNNLIKYNPLGYVSIYKFMTPVSGVLLSSFFLQEEKITVNILVALVFVSLGILMINYRRNKASIKEN